MRVTEIRVAGFGGQGVILATTVIGKAATLYENLYATMTQSFGPESRGGSSSASVIVSNQPILYPYVTSPDILVVLSQEACTRFLPELKPGGILLVEEDLVRLPYVPDGVRIYSIPATRIAEELGKKMVLNMVVSGFFGAATGLLRRDSLRSAVKDSVPAHVLDLNLRAFDHGYAYALPHGSQRTEEFLEPVAVEAEA